ncbi:MAG: DUF1501 domain-containing protein [Planctomycetes bacterium]|nr:DUF1501 domain-containing protein [Planctomycetota bacterium]
MPGPRCPLSRREVLRAGAVGLMGLSLRRLLAAGEASRASGLEPRADSCIVIFLNGGPSHLDMWDMKPEASVEVRGEFKPIPTSAPGVQLCEHLPRLARQMHRAALVRSMRHGVNNAHALAVYTALTGHDRGDANVAVGASAEDHPALGSTLTLLRPPEKTAFPYVALPYKTQEGAGGPPQPGFYAGIIGQGYDPFWVLSDPNVPSFSLPDLTPQGGLTPERMRSRTDLLRALDARFRKGIEEPGMGAVDRFHARALEVLTSREAQRAFRIQEEPEAVRDAYGRNIYGQSVLLARRLIEAGTRVVNISWAPDANATWDTHSGNFKKLKGTLLPQLDAACGSLLEDLAQRGLLERTIVAVLGDFGRTPKINKQDGGRDHWNSCYTILLAGGGIRPGFVLGSSDRLGALPESRPVTPGDVIATLYHLLGLDPRTEIRDPLQRPFPLVREGDVLRDLIA